MKFLKSLRPPGIKKKISTAEDAENAEVFFKKTKTMDHFRNIDPNYAHPGLRGFGPFLLLKIQDLFSLDSVRSELRG
jgi:hypothetical protein